MPGNGNTPQNKGYTRSQHLISGDAIRLRDDVGGKGDCATVITTGSTGDLERGNGRENKGQVSRGSSKFGNENGTRFGWDDSE